MNTLKIGFPLKHNSDIIPKDIGEAEDLYIVEIMDGSPRYEQRLHISRIAESNIDVFIVYDISEEMKSHLKNKGVLVLKTDVRNFKDALMGYATGMRRFKPL